MKGLAWYRCGEFHRVESIFIPMSKRARKEVIESLNNAWEFEKKNGKGPDSAAILSDETKQGEK